MSMSCDGPATIYDEKTRTARKTHACGACGETVPKGGRYVVHTALNDGRWTNVKRCLRCDKIYQFLCREAESSGIPDEEWPDYELRCGHTYQDLHGCQPPPEIAALAFAGVDGEL